MDDEQYHDYIPIEAPKDDYELFVETLELKINKEYNDLLKVNAKILYEKEKRIFNFYILIYDNSEINPFDNDIEINIEFIEDEPPYIQIISNFLTPTMYDFRNYFLCFSAKSKYIFKISNLAKSQIILEEIISKIKFFLNNIKECESLKTFTYLGEYDMNHIYHINDFFRNTERVDIFRINQIKDDKFYDNVLYVLCTELYFIVFEPIENDKSLGKILFYNKLSDTVFNFEEIGIYSDKKKEKKRLKVIVNDTKNKVLYKKSNKNVKYNDKIKINKYFDINTNHCNTINISNKNDEINHYTQNAMKNNSLNNNKKKKKIQKSETNNIQINNNIINDIDFFSNTKNNFEFLFIETNENEDNNTLSLQREYILFKKFIIKKDVLGDQKYKNIISLYRLLFTHSYSNLNKNYSLSIIKQEVDKILEYDEILFEKYKNFKDQFNKKRIKNIINNIIYLCSKFSELLYDEHQITYYINKMRKYANLKIN